MLRCPNLLVANVQSMTDSGLNIGKTTVRRTENFDY